MSDDSAQLPLDGIRVLDLSTSIGGYCGRLLADAGADVVKVERPGGDELRRRAPFADDRSGPERSLSFAYYHANKRGIAVDYGQPDALGTLAALGAGSDVIILTPSARDPVAGLDAARNELSWAGPDTVVCSITPFGRTGPYRSWRATHLTSYAMSGLMYPQGPPGGPPVVIPGQQLYDHVATHAAIAVLAALRERPDVGGQFIDVSAHEVLGHSLFDLYRYTNSLSIDRRGDRRPGASGGRWECRDGLIEFTVSTDKHWSGLVELLGSPEELRDPSWGHPVVREQHADKIMAVLTPLITAMSREDFVSRGQQLGVPCALVNTVGQFARDPQPRSRGFFVRERLPGLGEFELPGQPFLSARPLLGQYRRPAPRLGEHDAGEITRQWRAAPRDRAATRSLTGIRAISFGTAIAGALCGTALAELGADVVKIESPTRPDNLRRLWGPGDPAIHELSGADTSPMFANFNRTTRSLALDMKQPASVKLFLRLAEVADVIIENYGPGVMQRWGVGYDKIAAVNPRIVMLSLTGFGQTAGPRSHYLAYGSTICSFVGLTQAWGFSHGTHFDYVSEAHGLFGILVALAARDHSGLGTHVDLAEVESAAVVMGPLMLDYTVNGRDPVRGGNQVPWALFSEVIPCRGDDRWLAVEIEDAADLRRLARLVGSPDPGRPESPPDSRTRLRLSEALRTWAAALTPQQAMRAMQRAGLAAGAVQDSEDVVRDPQHRERHFLHEMNHPDLGVAEYASLPYRLAKTPPAIRRPTPRLGAHTIEILGEWLGMDAAEARTYAWPAGHSEPLRARRPLAEDSWPERPERTRRSSP